MRTEPNVVLNHGTMAGFGVRDRRGQRAACTERDRNLITIATRREAQFQAVNDGWRASVDERRRQTLGYDKLKAAIEDDGCVRGREVLLFGRRVRHDGFRFVLRVMNGDDRAVSTEIDFVRGVPVAVCGDVHLSGVRRIADELDDNGAAQ